MPKILLTLEAAKARDADIFAGFSKVKRAAQSHKRATKINQQRLEWTEQAHRLDTEAARLENDVNEAASRFGILVKEEEDSCTAEEFKTEVWSQMAGVRQLLKQLKQRDPARLRHDPKQAFAMQDLLRSMSAAMTASAEELRSQEANLDQGCQAARHSIRHDIIGTSGWFTKTAEDRADLSEEEDALLERMGDNEGDDFQAALGHLAAELRKELAQIEQDLADLRHKRRHWEDQAHFKFVNIKRQLQGRRDLLMDRLCIEFPQMSCEQLKAHDAHCDALRFASERQAAAFRRWRRERLSLLKEAQGSFEQTQQIAAATAARRQSRHIHRERQKELHARLEVEQARLAVKWEDGHRMVEMALHEQKLAEAESVQAKHRRAQQVKDLSKRHREKQLALQAQQEEELAMQERHMTEERAKRVRRNAEIVRIRRDMDQLKRAECAQRHAELEQERKEREFRLQQAMEKLRVEAPADPERLFRLPARSKAVEYMDPFVCVTRGPHAGFDENKLMGDARYKLAAALQAAGLFTSQAGHEALIGMPAPRPAQPHVVSQIFAA
mmetsp:Transcript_126288/g.252312  ORF Transcript_126288/g.252312 Transcript_126288/m.252312 type:complete len:555 (-) Transcript_126288:21-1685(-)